MPSKMFIAAPKSPLPKLYFLHGFLGDPEDWAEVISYLPDYTCIPLAYPFTLPSEGILVGYSMGGRIALESSLSKILISAHPGLQTEEERRVRAEHDEQWIHKLQTCSLTQFLEEWYRQPLFNSLTSHPSFSQILKRRLLQTPAVFIDQLRRHSLSLQSFQRPKKSLFIYGAKDTKYKQLYFEYKIPAREIPGVGHACHLENPKAVAQVVQAFLEKPRANATSDAKLIQLRTRTNEGA